MKKIALTVFTSAGLVAGSILLQTPAYPQGGHVVPRAGGVQRRLEVMATYLDLTDAQRSQAQQIFAAARSSAQPLVTQLQQGHQQVVAAVEANDTAKIDTLTAQQGKLIGNAAAIHARAMAQFYAILTPDQKAKADKLRSTIHDLVASHLDSFGVQ